MPPSPRPPRPTEAELRILRVLWERGAATVREVHAAQVDDRAVGYTTVLKLMQIMATKGLVARDKSRRSHVYRPLVGADETETRVVADVIDKVFAGSASRLVQRALATKPASAAELAAIRELLDSLDGADG